jgi:hypothetical protein
MPKQFHDLPQVALDHAIDHLPTFLDGDHEVGGEGSSGGWLLFG